eukprot:CAMPEP_0170191582 /NCGR_PEP_ID=MMETSP0040_2-20121228/52075_1 /TAXON_ID=641309 /ORGANISM="Lotharella oceanica, Strain CCMP622" /LENGTH=171 /DNA_ID=CAMNT_0010439703 /DNA_START=581 /DNA_END=1095 /DNA_ORIENTATION=-
MAPMSSKRQPLPRAFFEQGRREDARNRARVGEPQRLDDAGVSEGIQSLDVAARLRREGRAGLSPEEPLEIDVAEIAEARQDVRVVNRAQLEEVLLLGRGCAAAAMMLQRRGRGPLPPARRCAALEEVLGRAGGGCGVVVIVRQDEDVGKMAIEVRQADVEDADLVDGVSRE